MLGSRRCLGVSASNAKALASFTVTARLAGEGKAADAGSANATVSASLEAMRWDATPSDVRFPPSSVTTGFDPKQTLAGAAIRPHQRAKPALKLCAVPVPTSAPEVLYSRLHGEESGPLLDAAPVFSIKLPA